MRYRNIRFFTRNTIVHLGAMTENISIKKRGFAHTQRETNCSSR